MQRLKSIALLSGVVLAVAAASAPVAGAYVQFVPESKVKLKVLVMKAVSFKTTSGSTYSCSGGKGSGEIIGSRYADIALTLTGCVDGGFKCQSAGAPNEGEISLGSTEALLAPYESLESHKAALVLTYAERTWTCAGKGQGIRGSIVAPITPVNTKVNTHTVKLEENGKGEQTPTVYFDLEERRLEGFPELEIVSTNYLPGAMTTTLWLQPEAGSEAYEVQA